MTAVPREPREARLALLNGYPVVGELGSRFMGGPFRPFDTGLIHGLCMVTGRGIDVLAMVAHVERQGHGSAFIDALTRSYLWVGVWDIFNEGLHDMLVRRGFTASTFVHEGDVTTGLVWYAPGSAFAPHHAAIGASPAGRPGDIK